jgi:hypothetical protein
LVRRKRFSDLRYPTAGRVLAFLSRKTNDISRTAGKVKPAANAAFLGVLAFLQLIDFGVLLFDNKNLSLATAWDWQMKIHFLASCWPKSSSR